MYYTAITQYLGFWKFGDEYKVMGLAAYGEPEYLDEFEQLGIAGDLQSRRDVPDNDERLVAVVEPAGVDHLHANQGAGPPVEIGRGKVRMCATGVVELAVVVEVPQISQ